MELLDGRTLREITPDGRGYAYYYISMPSRLFEINSAP